MKIPKFCLPYVKDPLLLYENREERKVSAHTFITYVSIILSLPAFCAGYIIAHSQQIVDHLFLFHDIPTDWKVTVNSVYQQIKRGDKADQYSVQPMYDQQYESNISYFYFSLYFGLVIGSLVSFIPCDMVGRKKTMLYSILSTILMITVYMIFLSEDAVGKGELYVIRFLLGSSQSFLLISSMLYIVEVSKPIFCLLDDHLHDNRYLLCITEGKIYLGYLFNSFWVNLYAVAYLVYIL